MMLKKKKKLKEVGNQNYRISYGRERENVEKIKSIRCLMDQAGIGLTDFTGFKNQEGTDGLRTILNQVLQIRLS